MTREEAIARIKDHIEVHHIREDRAIKITQALNMAIEALERTEWHYPSRGELPIENEVVLCLQSDGTIPFIGIYSNNKWFNWYTKFIYEFEPKCWQYIVPPKEEE